MCAAGDDLQMPAICVCMVLVVYTLAFVVDTNYEEITSQLSMLTLTPLFLAVVVMVSGRVRACVRLMLRLRVSYRLS